MQVCILIDPSQTLAEANASDSSSSSDGGKPAAAQRAATSSNGTAAPEPTTASDLDTKKLVQVTESHTGKAAVYSLRSCCAGSYHRPQVCLGSNCDSE